MSLPRLGEIACQHDRTANAHLASKTVFRFHLFQSAMPAKFGQGPGKRKTIAMKSAKLKTVALHSAFNMLTPDHVVYVIEDEPAAREAVCDLLGSVGLNAQSFASAREFLDFRRPGLPSCILLDIRLPGISGLELQARLVDEDTPPIIFLTGSADVPSSVAAMKRGAVDFLTKPFKEADLIDAVSSALAKDRLRQSELAELSGLKARLNTLSERELQVMRLIIGGLMNKQAAAELGIQEVTLQVHRSRVMQKMAADSLADLVRMAERLQIRPSASRRAPKSFD